jgi:Ras GTPase-activating-like protein IQGAP2/3
MYINIAVHYVRPSQITYARDALQAVIREVIDSEDLDLEADPSLVREIANHDFTLLTQQNT